MCAFYVNSNPRNLICKIDCLPLDFVLCFRHFEVKNKDDATEAAMLFSVPDFVGDACKAIASRVRGSVASVQFDDFHKVISRAVCELLVKYADPTDVSLLNCGRTAAGSGGGHLAKLCSCNSNSQWKWMTFCVRLPFFPPQ